VDPALGQAQRAHLAEVRSRRDPWRVEALLGALGRAAEGSDNLMPQFIECVEADITLGEICGRLRQVWGEYRPAVTI